MEGAQKEKPTKHGVTNLSKYFWVLVSTGFFCLVLILFAAGLFIYQGLNQGWHLSENPSSYIEFGIFIGALLTPLVATASLFIFWKTLRVQMQELVESTESLKITAQANQGIVKQNERLFQLRSLHEKLSKDFPKLDKIEKLQLMSRNSDGSVKQTLYGDLEYKNIFHILLSEDIEFLQVVNTSQDALLEFNKFVNPILMLGTDFLNYIRLGGNAHHFMEEGNRLNDLTHSISVLFPNHIKKLESSILTQRLYWIHVINGQLKKELDAADDFLTSLLLSNEAANDDHPRYL